ncbi:MAG: ROK family protein, partial [Acidobacteria bacterium]|nr:ROK family protein [Acidobacteriota bacterium]
MIGAVEAGGTKFVCAVGTGPGERMLVRESFPTGGDPAALFDRIAAWFGEQEERYGRVAALGIASFGPVDLDP